MNWLTNQLLHNRGLGDNAVEKNAVDTLKNKHNNSNIEEKKKNERQWLSNETEGTRTLNQNNAHNLHRHRRISLF